MRVRAKCTCSTAAMKISTRRSKEERHPFSWFIPAGIFARSFVLTMLHLRGVPITNCTVDPLYPSTFSSSFSLFLLFLLFFFSSTFAPLPLKRAFNFISYNRHALIRSLRLIHLFIESSLY